MSMSKEELLHAIENLPVDQLKLVSDYVEKVSEEVGLDMAAFNYVIDNYSDTLKGLVER